MLKMAYKLTPLCVFRGNIEKTIPAMVSSGGID